MNFFSFSRTELAEYLAKELGLPSYRANQLFQWVYQKRVFDLELMTNIGKGDRAKVAEVLEIPSVPHSERQVSQDGTRKYLFSLTEGDEVESVMIKQPTRMTLCVSSQVGCALACQFCQTGTMGLKRHLLTEEIMHQVMGVLVDSGENYGDTFSNMVFMGMGEPLHNFENVSRALTILTDPYGLAISARKITVSTAGLLPAIQRFFSEKVPANLAVSLNATDDEVRSQVMPINKRYPIASLLDTLRSVDIPTRKRITIEYVMLKGVNDRVEDLKRLPKLLKGIPAKINLIPYNMNADLGFQAPDDKDVMLWQRELMKHHFVVTVRWSKGRDIDAACGQLVTKSKRKGRKGVGEESRLHTVSEAP